MAAPQFEEESSVPLAEVKEILQELEKRDTELNYRSNKAQEYLANFASLTPQSAGQLRKKLEDLKLTRLKAEHITKIIDLLPATVDELKAILQAYPLSMPKKDQEKIVAVTKEFSGES